MSAAAAALAVGLAVRWWRARYDSLGRARPFPAISVGLCVLLAAGGAFAALRHDRLEQRLANAASALAGTRVSVHCQTASQAAVDVGAELGFVRFGPDGRPEHQTEITWQACRDLDGWLGTDHHHPGRAQLIAVHVLTHETMHMAGSTDEAVAECRAVQRDAAMARRLGAGAVDARALAARYWREIYPAMPDNYRTSQCAPGAALDEHLPDAPWR